MLRRTPPQPTRLESHREHTLVPQLHAMRRKAEESNPDIAVHTLVANERVGVGKLSEASGTDACVQTRTVKHVIDHPECVRSTRPTHARARTDAAGALLHRYDSNTVEHDIAIVELQVLCYA